MSLATTACAAIGHDRLLTALNAHDRGQSSSTTDVFRMTSPHQPHLGLLGRLKNLGVLGEQELLALYVECASAEGELSAEDGRVLQNARKQISDLVNALRALRATRSGTVESGGRNFP